MRTVVKKIIYKLFGKKIYQKAYILGKIADIKNKRNTEPEFSVLNNFIKSDSTVLDVGANYGHYTVEMARLCKNGKVISFEPVPFTFGVLAKIIRHFRLGNVELHQLALSNKSGRAEMIVPLLEFGAPNTGIAFLTDKKGAERNSIEVTLGAGDKILNGQSIDFIKIDIEGFEPFAMEGLKLCLNTSRPVILIEFSHNCLKRAGFEPSDFAAEIRNNYKLDFYRLNNSALNPVHDSEPGDGYYFLIPTEKKLSDFNLTHESSI